jgi:alkanesulfonate monooxygenase SsuD/methylene tetrahydromethanopterin reductase-like flavin-dependent oxidoreductase (luciferase family)
MGLKFGLLLPHFGVYAEPDRMLRGAARAEALGFDSVWVRDHLIFEPHGEFEQPSTTFYEALTVLTAVGAVTERIGLGTGALIPFRHPLHTALTTAAMSNLFPGRLIVGMGGGNADRQFAAVGLGGVFRPDLVRSNANILRRLWTGDGVSYQDEHYSFEGVSMEPKPPGAPPPFWYCGNTPASVRRAVEFCDGWLPGRIGLATLTKRVASLAELSQQAGRERPTVGVIPSTSVERSRAEALSYLNIEGLLAWANHARFWVKPASGRFSTAEDLAGVMVAGSPEEVAAQCVELHRAGVDHLIFDLRLKFQRWFHQIEMLGSEVLPRVRELAAAGQGTRSRP